MLLDFDTGIRNHLLASPAITGAIGTRVYHDLAPEGVPMPYILLSLQGSRDLARTKQDEIELTYNVKVVSSSYAQAVQLYGVVRVVLNDLRPTVNGWGVYQCAEQSMFRFYETIERTLIVYVGGLYRVGAVKES